MSIETRPRDVPTERKSRIKKTMQALTTEEEEELPSYEEVSVPMKYP
jgi:hypothetical protein